mgnify:CR=1 FL=1
MKFAAPSLKPEDKPILIASAFIVVILCVGTVYTLSTAGTAPLLSPSGARFIRHRFHHLTTC